MTYSYRTFDNPTTESSQCCCTSTTSPALLVRSLLHIAVPIIFGLGSGMLAEWGERTLGTHNSTALIELSDFTSCAATLIAAYTINALLNCCWPKNPYSQTDFSQSSIKNGYTSPLLSNIGLQNA